MAIDASDTCKTVKIITAVTKGNPDGFTEINETDFDPKIHQIYGEKMPLESGKPWPKK